MIPGNTFTVNAFITVHEIRATDLAQIQSKGELTSSCLADELIPFNGEPGFVKHRDLPLAGASMRPPPLMKGSC